MPGIVAYASYLPANVVSREEMGRVLGDPPGKGVRATAGVDEDTTTMAVAAVRQLGDRASGARSLWFVTTDPAYLQKTNATVVHAAAGLAATVPCADLGPSVRSAAAGLHAAAQSHGVLALSDRWTGRPGSADERAGGDAAAAFVFGDEEPLAELTASASRSLELLDRWQLPEESDARTWDERFAPTVLLPAVDAVLSDLSGQGVEAPDHVVVVAPNPRVVRAVQGRMPMDRLMPPLDEEVGFTGAAHLGLGLADVLDRAEADQTVLVVQVADGVDAFAFRTTDRLSHGRQAQPLRQATADRREVPYATFLTWTGRLDRQPPRRPEPQGPAAPPSSRNEAWKYRLVGARCTACDTVHAPPDRVCRGCDAVDEMVDHPLADRLGTVRTLTVDRLAYTLDPPVTVAVLDLDGGGRIACEVTDTDPESVRVGDRMALTFRRLFTAEGVHNYFFKARPAGRTTRGAS
jgi:hydroxymethylglutaryl-CoA synthase